METERQSRGQRSMPRPLSTYDNVSRPLFCCFWAFFAQVAVVGTVAAVTAVAEVSAMAEAVAGPSGGVEE